jgi:hypothetical protein
MRGKSKKIKKASKGIQAIKQPDLTKLNEQNEQQANIKDAASGVIGAGLNMVVPGAGTAITGVSKVMDGMTKDENGIYKSKTSQILNERFNPMAGVDALASGNGKAISNYFTFGLAGESMSDQNKKMVEQAKLKAKNDDFNNGITTSNPLQKKQFKKGGTVKMKASKPHDVRNTPLLPSEEVEFQKWRKNQPPNLQADNNSYDLRAAWKDGMKAEYVSEDNSYHLPGRTKDGRIIKSNNHPTFKKALDTDMDQGYMPIPKNGQMYTKNLAEQSGLFKKGGTAKQQVIEIEGKEAPEIHTDKSMTQVKSLGKTPHSKGGDKVLAEEGDVVFPTQNSPAKYNKIMKAIREKDLPTLKKEKSKLPKDNAPKKYSEGSESIGKRDGIRRDENGNIIPRKGIFAEPGVLEDNRITNRVNNNVLAKSTEAPSFIQSWINDNNDLGRNVTPAEKSKQGTASDAKSVSKTGNTIAKEKVKAQNPLKEEAILKSRNFLNDERKTDIDLSAEAKAKWDKGVKEGKYGAVPSPETFIKNNPPKDNKFSTDKLDSAMELAPIVHNLGKGLFGKTEKVNRDYLTTDKLSYKDMSDPLRKQSNQIKNIGVSNARNLSGGNLGNVRSNSQAAASENLDRLNQINSQEISRHDSINQSNVQMDNNTKSVNLQLKNQYDEADSANRGAKSALLGAGLTGLSELGARNKAERNQRLAQDKELDAIREGTVFEEIIDENGEKRTVLSNSKRAKTIKSSSMPSQKTDKPK